ncbi:fatty acid desaturase family protein [Spartinivicinus poritis]|uniref:Fatty acid desaturase n=1 Tax=Spartinivicinus poritis TaxID=2994640 RepID=A0ABT5UAI0_9GAMM|nr:fatty acid desaturase [Spartinivicinus sp. A2-2]MDE1463388.1 fatty acid desaturase [Spartinivicinus sp. A2-2]
MIQTSSNITNSSDTFELPEHSADIRVGRDLIAATVPFAKESRVKSWWHVGVTLSLMIIVLAFAGAAPWWPLQLMLSILGAMLMVRTFITYHDYMHGSILQNSRAAWIIFHIYAAFALTPPSSWKESHNFHHGHVGKFSAVSIGTFPVITTKMWHAASFIERARYRIERHPFTVMFGYLTIFAFSICLLPLFLNPLKHWDSLLSIIAHGGLITVLWVFGGADMAFFVVLLPMTIACALGSYLFFAQHSFKRMNIISPEAWTFYRAALESSSYMRLNKVMQWFTGNIGYHHIHHLNVHIPFYRLPEAMAAIPELQSPVTTTLALRDVINCFKSSLWDEELQHMVTYREAKKFSSV